MLCPVAVDAVACSIPPLDGDRTMITSSVSGAIFLVSYYAGGGVAFHYNSLLQSSKARRRYDTNGPLFYCVLRRYSILLDDSRPAVSSSTRMSRASRLWSNEGCDRHELDVHASTSRREVILRCFTTLTASAFGWAMIRDDAANASDFSLDEITKMESNDSLPQRSDETNLLPDAMHEEISFDIVRELDSTTMLVADPSSSSAYLYSDSNNIIDRKAENSVTASSTAVIAKLDEDTPTIPMTTEQQQLQSSALAAEIGLTAIAIGGMSFMVSGRSFPKNDDFTAVKAKVVMIQPEPYGLGTGRRFYDGVNLRMHDPVPSSDIMAKCDAGVIDDGCTAAITTYLNKVPEHGPRVEQTDTANVVLSYLDSLSSSSSASEARPVAFSSYIDVLSRGEIDPPHSPQLVADYLASLNKVKNRITALETSVNSLPDEISIRLENWQREREDQLEIEITKIKEYLIENNSFDEEVPSVDMNGNYKSANGSYGTTGFFNSSSTYSHLK